jgi:glycosyltransferase involved in cell wall biosynthesis
MPAVSVLMPCYNAARTIDEALTSLANQTLNDYELIAVDDGSSDQTLDILNRWAGQDARIQVLVQPHAGILEALNHGLTSCCAPYVARMDTDDRSHPERLELQVHYLDENPKTAVVGSLVAAFPAGQVRQGFQIYLEWLNALVSDEAIRREIFIESPLAHPSVAFRRELVVKAGGYQEHGWPEDYDLWLRLYCMGAQFAKIPRVLLEWREHPQRLTRTDSRYSLENFLRAKAQYLARGPLAGRDGILIWGAGMIGRRLSKHLLRQNCPLVAFVDIDPHKIGRTRRGYPIIAPKDLPALWDHYTHPVLLAAVGARGARALIRARLVEMGLVEGRDWWGAA